METAHVLDRPNASPVQDGVFSPIGLIAALAVGPVVGLAWAWMAETVQFYVAPFLLFPVLVGVFTGLTIVGLVRFAQLGHRPTILLAAGLAAAVAAFGQHYLEYRSAYSKVSPASIVGESFHRQDYHHNARAISPDFAPSFGKYLCAQANCGRPLPFGFTAVGWAAWLTWAIDSLLVIAAAVAVTIPAVRVPYCNRCRSWYRTVRNGKIDVPTARRVAALCGVEEIADLRSPRYRLSCCRAGCSPTYCELSWEEPTDTINLVRVLLDREKRNQIATVLDELTDNKDEG